MRTGTVEYVWKAALFIRGKDFLGAGGFEVVRANKCKVGGAGGGTHVRMRACIRICACSRPVREAGRGGDVALSCCAFSLPCVPAHTPLPPSRTRPRPHARSRTRTPASARTHVHAHNRPHARTRTHPHTHTHARLYTPPPPAGARRAGRRRRARAPRGLGRRHALAHAAVARPRLCLAHALAVRACIARQLCARRRSRARRPRHARPGRLSAAHERRRRAIRGPGARQVRGGSAPRGPGF